MMPEFIRRMRYSGTAWQVPSLYHCCTWAGSIRGLGWVRSNMTKVLYRLHNIQLQGTVQVKNWFTRLLERSSTWLSGRRLPSCRPRSSGLTVSRQHDAGHPSYDDVTGRQSICRRRTACLEQPCSCHPWSVTVAVNLRKAAENLFVCLRVAALVTYELAPWKCTD